MYVCDDVMTATAEMKARTEDSNYCAASGRSSLEFIRLHEERIHNQRLRAIIKKLEKINA